MFIRSMHSILLIISLFLWHDVQGDLVIKPTETSLTRDQYTSFVAVCTGQSNTRVTGWRSPQQRDIPENEIDRVTIERPTDGLKLRIQNLTTEDQGTWECLGTDSNGREVRKSFRILIRVPITFYGESVQYAALAESVLIKCRVQASPTAEVSWFKGRDRSRIDRPHYERTSEGLRINRVEMNDNDTFWCRADVLETGESRDFPITVVISKSVTHPRITCANPCAIEKKTATLVCEASGLPPPKYLWFYGSDSPVGASEVPKFVVRGNQLTINYVDETDNGKYSCQAFNEYDRKGQRAEFNLNVIVPPRLAPIPAVEINFDDQHRQSASFVCRVERGSAESLSLEWQYLNGSSLQPTNDIFIKNSEMQSHRSIELRFDPVRREHFGNYSCVAKNLADSSYSLASLYINFPPVFIGPDTKVISSIPNFRIFMHCQFESYPPPQIQWIKLMRTAEDPDGRLLAPEIDSGVNDITTRQVGPILFESILSYSPTERDFGLSFECRALNPRVGRHSFTLQRAEPPRVVRMIEVKPLANGAEVLVQQPESGGLPVASYVIKYQQAEADNRQWQTLNFTASTNSQEILKIENLQPSTSYRFTILAESRAGIGREGNPILFKTLDRQVPEFKIITTEENKTETCLGDTHCLIKWIIESDGGAPIVGAEILYAKAKTGSGLQTEGDFGPPIRVEPSISEYELTGLRPNISYIVMLKLHNEAGVAEQRVRKTTSKHKSGGVPESLKPGLKRYRSNQPSIWLIIGIIVIIILSLVGFVVICAVIRVRRMTVKKNNTTDSASKKSKEKERDHQTSPMINGSNGESQSEQLDKTNGYKNGYSPSKKLGDAV